MIIAASAGIENEPGKEAPFANQSQYCGRYRDQAIKERLRRPA
jgi:hypothetical protein